MASDAQPQAEGDVSFLARLKGLPRDYLVGIGLLLAVVFLWTSSNFITQDLYEGGYEKPFLVTYLNTSAFTFYLIPWFARRWFGIRKNKHNPAGEGYQVLSATDNGDTPVAAVASTFRAPSVLSDGRKRLDELDPLSLEETMKLAATFCIFWFIANWSVNASLNYTSVASTTVLSSTSGFFTLLVGRMFKVESLSAAKIGAVIASFFGVVLVSISDYSTTVSQTGNILSENGRTPGNYAVMGDFFALLSALFYSLYVVLLKVRIKQESRVDMQLFFGFVGAFNVILLWPLGLILHLVGVEVLEMPPTRSAWTVILVNMIITLFSDFIYVIAMLKTTPLVVTVGLSLTIPLAIIGDFFLKIGTSLQAIFGAIFVLGGFIVVGVADSGADDVASEVSPVEDELRLESDEPASERPGISS